MQARPLDSFPEPPPAAGRPESMPGGVVTQSFTVPAGVASIDHALVQIDPDTRVTASATLHVNGQQRASAATAAVGDTHFGFPAVAVKAGDTTPSRCGSRSRRPSGRSSPSTPPARPAAPSAR